MFRNTISIYLIVFSYIFLFTLDNPAISASVFDINIYKTQRKLDELGYSPGPLDGIWGKKTEAAIKKFQKDQGLPTNGKLDTNTKILLYSPKDADTTGETQSIAPESNQIDPSETAGACLQSALIFKEYKKNEKRFRQLFDDNPLCISGHPEVIGEESNYFYINITEKNEAESSNRPQLVLQCRIEKLNEIHRRILKNNLNIKPNHIISVKGIYQTSINKEILILDQCYILVKKAKAESKNQ